jgi:hypothetical protein
LHAQRQAARRETARHRQGWAAAEVERLRVNVIPDLTTPRGFGLFVVRITTLRPCRTRYPQYMPNWDEASRACASVSTVVMPPRTWTLMSPRSGR